MFARCKREPTIHVCLHAQLNYFACKEFQIAHVIARHFHWQENNVWFEELPPDVTVVFSGNDSVAPVETMKEYLRNQAMKSAQVSTLLINDVTTPTGTRIDKYQYMRTMTATGTVIPAVMHLILFPNYRHAEFLTSRAAINLLVRFCC
jgi:hypothetical protein